jgi:hypothetical protein
MVLQKNEKIRLLDSLCGRKRCCLPPECREREFYDLTHDCSMYRDKIAAIYHNLSLRKPRTWKESWHHKRDSAQWHTIRLVLIVGVIYIILTDMRVVIQILQVV